MSYKTCSELSLYQDPDFCIPVTVDEEQKEFTINGGWIAGAFFLGLLLGIGIVLLLARPFLAAWEKKKRQDEEKILEGTDKSDVIEARAVTVNGYIDEGKEKSGKEKIKEKMKNMKGKTRFWRKASKGVAEDKSEEEPKESDIDPALTRGMVEIMTQTSSAGEEMEMAEQDMAAIISMERSSEEEKTTVFLQTLALLLRKKMEKRQITQNYYVDFVKKTEQDLKDMAAMIEREKEEAEAKIKNDPKLSKDTQTMETEMQKLQTHYTNKQAKHQRQFRDKIRLDLLRSSGMSEAEVEDMMSKLMGSLSIVEEKLGLEQARQRRALDQRLAKRRQAMEYQQMEAKEKSQEEDARVDLFRSLLDNHTKDGSMLESHRDEIVKEYENDLNLIRKYHSDDLNLKVSEKLLQMHEERVKSFIKLNKSHEKEKAAFLHNAEKVGNSTDFIQLYHDLMVKQQMDKESLCNELDQREMQAVVKLKEKNDNNEAKEMDEAINKMSGKLEATSDLSAREADRLLKLHKQEVAQFHAKRQKEKQAMLTRLQEKLQQRLAAADEAEAKDQQEQETLKEQQMATLEKVLKTNLDLTEEAKDRVLKEHEQNMQALSNQLTRSKLRQQKSLEIKLNQRRAKMAELQQKKEELQAKGNNLSEKERNSKTAQLEAEIASEEQSFEEARKAAVAELRRQLAQETEEALKNHDAEIGILIARLQLGQARRKAILEKQDAVLKDLQDQLERQVSSSSGLKSNVTDQILQQHYNQVSHLNDKIQRHREHQEHMIQNKLAQKKAKREYEIENQLEEEAQKEYTEQQKRGAGYASLALMQSFLEQRHSRALQELETEMKAELEKSKSELNMELEQELRKELEDQRQQLLTHLAAVGNISQKELQNAVSAATLGKSDSKAAKRLAKDLKEGVERAKSSMAMSYGEPREDLAYRRARTDLDSSQDFDGSGRPRRGSAKPSQRRPSVRPAFAEDDDEDDY